MKIAVVVANTGNIDNIKGLPKQSLDIEYHLFHDGNLPFPLPNLSSRMRARYIKIMMHRYLRTMIIMYGLMAGLKSSQRTL